MTSPKRKFFIIFFLILFVWATTKIFGYFSFSKTTLDFSSRSKKIYLNDNGTFFETITNSDTVSDFLKEKGVLIGDRDKINLPQANRLYPGVKIEINRVAKLKILVDGEKIENYTYGKNVQEVLRENQITLSRLDKTDPPLGFPAVNGTTINVTRIDIENVVKKEEIDFKTIVKNDPKMSWREKIVSQPGQKGIRETTYQITYKNNQEVSRKILEKNIISLPVEQIETQGTYVKTGKAQKGLGTWYAFRGGLFAASTTLPRDSYAKVTNLENGKTVIVQINDYGPQGKGRIIDLDKIAFQKIASLGAGVINVKVEPVLN